MSKYYEIHVEAFEMIHDKYPNARQLVGGIHFALNSSNEDIIEDLKEYKKHLKKRLKVLNSKTAHGYHHPSGHRLR